MLVSNNIKKSRLTYMDGCTTRKETPKMGGDHDLG